MADQPSAVVVEERLVLVDAEGNVTDDWGQAVRGEVTETLADGTTRSTLFDLTATSPR